MAPLPAQSSRPPFQTIGQAILYYWLTLEAAIVPQPAKAAVPPRPASGGNPAVVGVAGVVAKPGVANLVASYTFLADSENTTLGFRLPLGTGANVALGAQDMNFFKQVKPVAATIPAPITWALTGSYSLPVAPSWCLTIEQLLAWLARNHAGTTVTLASASSAIDFKVTIPNSELGDLDLLIVPDGSVVVPPSNGGGGGNPAPTDEFALLAEDHPAWLSLYINSSTGNDTTGTGSPSAPFQSMSRAIAFALTKNIVSGCEFYPTGTFNEPWDFRKLKVRKITAQNGQGYVGVFLNGTANFTLANQLLLPRDRFLNWYFDNGSSSNWVLSSPIYLQDCRVNIAGNFSTTSADCALALLGNALLKARNCVMSNLGGNQNTRFIKAFGSQLFWGNSNNMSNFTAPVIDLDASTMAEAAMTQGTGNQVAVQANQLSRLSRPAAANVFASGGYVIPVSVI